MIEEGRFFFFGRNEILGEEEAYRCWTLWKPGRRGTGTKMTMAFLPWPTSICVMDRLLLSLGVFLNAAMLPLRSGSSFRRPISHSRWS